MKYLNEPHQKPATMPQSLDELAQFVTAASAYTTSIHLDVSDGKFSPSLQWPLQSDAQRQEFATLVRGEQTLPPGASSEVHLMTENPRELGELFAHAGVRRIIGHLEAFESAEAALRALSAWREAGAQEVGIALLITTPISKLEGVAEYADVVQLMSIPEIGYQGKAFDERALSRVEEVHAAYPDMMVAVDGGISEATVESLVRAGANRLVVGSAIRASKRPAAAYAQILERAMKGCVPVQSEEAAAIS